MEDNKDLGKLFKERLENTEVEPSATLWSQIEKTLDTNQKKAALYWYWSGGMLALASLIIWFSYTELNSKDEPIQAEAPNVRVATKETNEKIDEKSFKVTNTNTIQSSNNTNIDKTIDTSAQKNNRYKAATTQPMKEATYTSTKSKKASSSQNSKLHKEQAFNTAVKNDEQKAVRLTQKPSLNEKNASYNTTPNQREIPTHDEQELDTLVKSTNTNPNQRENLTQNEQELDTLVKPDTLAKKLLFKEMPEAKEKEKPEAKLEPPKKWLITVQGGPNIYGNLSNTLPFDDVLADRNLRPGISSSYGALINLPINEKFSVRFGYRKHNLKLLAENAVHSVDSVFIQGFQSIAASDAITGTGTSISADFLATLSPPNPFKIEQNIEYYAFPIELMYRLKDGQLKIDGIVGANFMALGNNSISLENQFEKLRIGNPRYLKKSFIAPSLGIGFKYQVFDFLSVDVEPMFQYQLNAIKGNFKNGNPIIFSVNFGTTIKL